MSESYVCPKCNSTKFIGYDDASGAECKECGHFIPDNKLDDYAYVKIKKSELASRDEIITRLKEDGERLAVVNGYYCCNQHENYLCHLIDVDTHAPDCPITLHRALWKELENK